MARRSVGRALATIAVVVGLATCGGRARGNQEERQAVTSKSIEAVLAAHSDSLMALPGVVGTAIGLCDGARCIRVFLADSGAAARRRIPQELEGYPLKVEVTGPIRPRRPGTP